jgi:23S rRNA (adenine2503-C2)-methyltransferase
MLLKNHTTAELEALTAAWPLRPRILRQLQSHTLKRGAPELGATPIDGVSKADWARIQDNFQVPHLEILEKVVSPFDGFAKYLFKSPAHAEPFEAVRIPLLHRPGDEKYVVCVSSQVGCAARCAFCATGRLGFKRSLETWEIVDQVVKIRDDSAFPVRGVVFMGMGEPFLNYANVLRAAELLADPSAVAIDGKAITVSTVGVVPMIRRFTKERRPYRLIVSLSSAFDAQRDELLPMNQNYPIASIMDALREYQAASGRRVSFAWTMMAGVNMDRAQVLELARVTQGMKILLDLIPVNDATGRFAPPGKDELDQFLGYLRDDLKAPVVCRYSGGKDVAGACGMLAGKRAGEAAPIEPFHYVP